VTSRRRPHHRQTRPAPCRPPRPRLPTVPGLGKRLCLVRLYDIQEVHRFPRGQAGVSACRLGKGARASAGTRDGTSGSPIGQAPLQWAFAAAAVWGRRDPPTAQQDLARLENNPEPGTARTLRAQPWARAV
jgi:hypothetical protein